MRDWIRGWKGNNPCPEVAKTLVILITTVIWKANGSRRKRWRKTHIMWPAAVGCSWQGVSSMRPRERHAQVINPNERRREECAGTLFYGLKESTNILMG